MSGRCRAIPCSVTPFGALRQKLETSKMANTILPFDVASSRMQVNWKQQQNIPSHRGIH